MSRVLLGIGFNFWSLNVLKAEFLVQNGVDSIFGSRVGFVSCFFIEDTLRMI